MVQLSRFSSNAVLVGVLTFVSVVLISGSLFSSHPLSDAHPPVEDKEIIAASVKVLEGRTIVDYGLEPVGVVAYSYLGKPVPELFDEREVPALRTENSYTKFIEVVQPGDDPIVKLEAHIYAQPVFAKDVDGSWKYLEYATTTRQAFENRKQTLWHVLTEMLVRTTYAASISPFSGAGDGYVPGQGLGSDASQSTCESQAWGSRSDNTFDYTTVTMDAQVSMAAVNEPPWACTADTSQVFIPFVTSAMPGGSTVSAATLNVYVTAKTNSDNDGTDYLTVVQTSQATHTSLVASDYNNVSGEGIDSGERKDITSISTSAYLVFTLNATGRGWIKGNSQSSNCSATPGITCLGIQEGHDFANSQIASSATNAVTLSSSEDNTGDGDDHDPYLSVTYTAPASIAFGPSFSVGDNGVFQVGDDGNLQIGEF